MLRSEIRTQEAYIIQTKTTPVATAVVLNALTLLRPWDILLRLSSRIPAEQPPDLLRDETPGSGLPQDRVRLETRRGVDYRKKGAAPTRTRAARPARHLPVCIQQGGIVQCKVKAD